jgi:hypothetical protein
LSCFVLYFFFSSCVPCVASFSGLLASSFIIAL